jgi:hypothetical protein
VSEGVSESYHVICHILYLISHSYLICRVRVRVRVRVQGRRKGLRGREEGGSMPSTHTHTHTVTHKEESRDRVVSRGPGVTVTCDTRGNLGPCTVINQGEWVSEE